MFKVLTSLFFFLLLSCASFAQDTPSFVSISPASSEIMFAIGAQDNLKAVSSQCNFPKEVKDKPIIGDYYFINESMLIDIHPDYFLAPDSADFLVNKYKKIGITPLCFRYENINSVYENILALGKLTNNEKKAENLVSEIKSDIICAKRSNKNKNKKIFYVVSVEPLRTIGKKSFITDVINESGNISITNDVNNAYPVISAEYVISKNPDIVVFDYTCFGEEKLMKLLPNAKKVKLTKAQSDIINRPAARIAESVLFFARLGNY